MKSYQDHLRDHKRVEAYLQRLRLYLANREAKVGRLRSQALDWKQKSLSAVRDRDVIRTHLAQLASRSFRLPSEVSSAASANPPTGKRSRSTEPDLPIKRPLAAKMTRSGTESVFTASVKPAGESSDPLGLCNSPHHPYPLEHPLSLRDLPDQLALTIPKPRKDLHGPRQLKSA